MLEAKPRVVREVHGDASSKGTSMLTSALSMVATKLLLIIARSIHTRPVLRLLELELEKVTSKSS